jgi:Smg protein
MIPVPDRLSLGVILVMKENMLDVLLYLFDNYLDDGGELGSDRDSMKSVLVGQGFREETIERAFSWLEGLVPQPPLAPGQGRRNPAFRIYNSAEQERLSRACRGFLLGLETVGVLDIRAREMVIEQAMALDSEELDIEQLKWVTQLVLSNQPQDDEQMAWMNGVIFDEASDLLH